VTSLITCLLMIPRAVSADDVTGSYKGTLTSPDEPEPLPVSLLLVQTGKEVKGSITLDTGRGNARLTISAGFATDTALHFVASAESMMMGPMELEFDGRSDGDEVKGQGSLSVPTMMGPPKKGPVTLAARRGGMSEHGTRGDSTGNSEEDRRRTVPQPKDLHTQNGPNISAGSVGTFRGTLTSAGGRSSNVEAVCNGESGRILVIGGGSACPAAILWSPGGKAWIYVPVERRVRPLDAEAWVQSNAAGTGLSPAQMAGAVCKVSEIKSQEITFVPSSSSQGVDPGDLTVEALVNACK
jgi:hypothetical protein